MINGVIGQTIGETTRRSTRFEDLKEEPIEPHKFSDLFTIPSHRELPKVDTASIRLSSINTIEGGFFDVTFSVDTGLCSNSACAGFDATLVLEDNGQIYEELYSFDGWAVGDTGTSIFQIAKSGTRNGTLVDVVNIESPEIVCNDDI